MQSDARTPPSVFDLHWAAGFLEGEGSFQRTNQNSHMVSADQVEKEPVLRLLNLFGGNIIERPAGRKAGSARNSQLAYRWYVCGTRARNVMAILHDLMTTKRQRQIEATLDGWVDGRRREARDRKKAHTLTSGTDLTSRPLGVTTIGVDKSG